MMLSPPFQRDVARLATNLDELRTVGAAWCRVKNSQLLLEAERLLHKINDLLDERLKLIAAVEKGRPA